jgi:M6 family metalloprotease-like protein/uncharacterized repeat protein (TIGR02543 family)
LFNDTAAGANSMYNYYKEVSYDQLGITTTFYPTTATIVVSYQDSQPRAYYQPYNEVSNPDGYQDDAENTEREHTLLKNAVDHVSSQIPDSLNIDADDDNYVDNVCFIIYGDPDGWNELLWPHRWYLYSVEAYINGKRVLTYNFQLQTSLYSSGVGVLCHEMFHSLGAPDLYHYSHDELKPVYRWDIMENNLNPPQHMGAYMKYRYGTWISSIPEITSDGTYDLNPLISATNNCYKVASPYSSTEYFMLEYRKKSGTFENSLPGEGLLVYRINTNKDGEGNEDGPPDEVYIYRPDGTTTVNGSPSSANFSTDADRTAINDTTNPSSFLSNGSQGGLDISNVGSVNGVISFDVTIVPGLELAEALDNYDLSWQSGGDGDGWYGQMGVYFYDDDAAESGYISDNQSNYLETTVQGPVNLAFYWKVSSEEDYDFLTFYVDDIQIYQISGEVDWEQKIYSVSEGSHSIKWEYKKDEFVSDGFDCGWVDKVEYTSEVIFTFLGAVKTSGGEGVEGVTIAFSNEGGTATTDSDGNYSHPLSDGYSGTATPAKTGYIFSPTSRDYPNVTSGQTNENYTATLLTYTISGNVGTVVSAASGEVRAAAALSGVLMDGLPGDPTTDDSGNYTATADYGFSGTVTPTLAGYSFSPSSRDYTSVTSDQLDNYTASIIQHTLTIIAGSNGRTSPTAGTSTHDYGAQIQVTATPDSGYQFSGWTGAASGTTNPITITMDADKSITASFTAISTGDGDGGGGGGCFIATAAYGTPLHPHLDILRDFRGSFLMPSRFGRKLVELYYRYSPGIANFIAGHKLLKAAVRVNLLPVIAFSSLMVHFGPAATAIVLVFILVFSILFIRFYPGRMRVL